MVHPTRITVDAASSDTVTASLRRLNSSVNGRSRSATTRQHSTSAPVKKPRYGVGRGMPATSASKPPPTSSNESMRSARHTCTLFSCTGAGFADLRRWTVARLALESASDGSSLIAWR